MLPKINNIFRLTREPELRHLQDGKELCKINVACSEKYGQKETSMFIDAVAFGKGASFLNNVKKGDRIFISGKLSPNNYEKQDGTKIYGFQLLIDSFEYIEKKSDNPQQQDRSNNQTQQDLHALDDATNPGGEIDIDEDLIPF